MINFTRKFQKSFRNFTAFFSAILLLIPGVVLYKTTLSQPNQSKQHEDRSLSIRTDNQSTLIKQGSHIYHIPPIENNPDFLQGTTSIAAGAMIINDSTQTEILNSFSLKSLQDIGVVMDVSYAVNNSLIIEVNTILQ